MTKKAIVSEILLIGKNGEYRFIPSEKPNVLRANGKFSIIYKGEDLKNNAPVIIKMLHPKWNSSTEERKRFVNEFLNAIENEYLPKTIDICESGENLYIVREFIEGKDLANYNSDKGLKVLVNQEGKPKIILKILDAFISLHRKKIIHGDIKPSNILLSEKNGEIRIRIIDLGLALPFDHSFQRDPKKILPFALLYAAPELMLNYAELIHPSTDIYSLSLTIYEFLTGEKPFEVSNPAILMSVQLNQVLEKHRKINSATLSVLNKAAFKFSFQKPIQNYPSSFVKQSLNSAIICRYQTMKEFKSELEIAFEKKDGFWKKVLG